MTDIYIHIGTHKTGTTTIQHALRSAAGGNLGDWIYIGAPPTAKDFMRTDQYDKKLVKNFKAEIQRKMPNGEPENPVVLSSEALSGMPTSGYQNSNVVYSMLRDATDRYNVKIVIYLRRQDSFVESMYTQKIHEGEAFEFESFLKQYDAPDALDYYRMIADLIEFFGDQNLVVRSYHEASEKGLISDFGKIIVSKLLQCTSQGDKNPSYSRDALEIAKICNASLDGEQKRRLRRTLQETMAKERSESFAYFTDEDRVKFLEKYEASNLDVASRFFGGDIDRLFPAPKASTPVSHNESLAHDKLARLVVNLLNENDSNPDRGIKAGIRVALSGYPRLRRLIRKVRQRL